MLKFDVFSTYSGAASPIKKLIILTIINCKELGCQIWVDSSAFICQAWKDDYTLHFKHWFQIRSSDEKGLGIFVLCLILLTFFYICCNKLQEFNINGKLLGDDKSNADATIKFILIKILYNQNYYYY